MEKSPIGRSKGERPVSELASGVFCQSLNKTQETPGCCGTNSSLSEKLPLAKEGSLHWAFYLIAIIFPGQVCYFLSTTVQVESSCGLTGNIERLRCPLSCLESSMGRGAWQATVHGVSRVGHNLATKPPPIPDWKL